MKVILHCEAEDIQHVAALVQASIPTFVRHAERIGWGWNFRADNGKSYFVRRLKDGFSATPTDAGRR